MNRRCGLGAGASTTAVVAQPFSVESTGHNRQQFLPKQSPGTKTQRRSPFLSPFFSLTNTATQATPPPKHSGRRAPLRTKPQAHPVDPSCPFPCSHLLDHISVIFPPFSPVFCAFSPSRRGGSNEPQAGTQSQETAGTKPKRGKLPLSFDTPGANQRINWMVLFPSPRHSSNRPDQIAALLWPLALDGWPKGLGGCARCGWRCGAQAKHSSHPPPSPFGQRWTLSAPQA